MPERNSKPCSSFVPTACRNCRTASNSSISGVSWNLCPHSIDGQSLEIPAALAHLHYIPYGNLADGKAVPCGDRYYVLGDDTRDSNDSRFEGPIREEKIIGQAWLIVRPQSRFGFVNR